MKTLTAEQIARVCHEANRTYCRLLGDQTHNPWFACEQSLRDSVVDGVKRILTGDVKSPEDSHNSWLEFKRADGWKYGKVKDFEARTHPCFLPYHELTLEHRLKDKLFFTIVRSLEPATIMSSLADSAAASGMPCASPAEQPAL